VPPRDIRTIVVCEAQVPFVRGGAEFHVRELVDQLRLRGYEAELVSLPYKWYPKEELLNHAAAWRLLDLSESNGRPIDLAIGTKFPTYFARHPNKVAWVIHQYRAAYDLCGTPYSDFEHVEADVGLRQRLVDLDRQMLGSCRRIYSNARNTADRLEAFNGLRAEPLYHPPRLAGRLLAGPYGDYVLSVGRLETVKRADLAVEALRHIDPGIRLLIAGDGTQRDAVAQLAEDAGVADRVTLLGTVGDDELVDLYREALAVIYAPYDEDYGYVTLEAFLAARPVITAHDAGGVLEFVEADVSGLVCVPEAEAIGDAVNRLGANRALAAELGAAGRTVAERITWEGVVEKLVGG